MVNGKLVAIAALAVCLAAVGAVTYTSFSYDEIVEYPGSEMTSFPDMEYMKVDNALRDFRVVICYHFDKIYEGAEFRVDVFDKDTEKVAEGANVSFMLPGIYHTIPKEGSVYFYAPDIHDEYLLHPNDTYRFFPLVVNKEGYNTYNTIITVHLAE